MSTNPPSQRRLPSAFVERGAVVFAAAGLGLPFVLPGFAQDPPPAAGGPNSSTLSLVNEESGDTSDGAPAPALSPGGSSADGLSLGETHSRLPQPGRGAVHPRDAAALIRKARLNARRQSRTAEEFVRHFTREIETARGATPGRPGPEDDSAERNVPTPSRGGTNLSDRLLKALEATRYASNFAGTVEREDVGELAEELLDGTPVEEDEFPEVVALGSGPSTYRCSGILIGPRIVLTAGHCRENNNAAWVYVGNDATQLPDLVNDDMADYRELGVYRALPDPLRHEAYGRDVLNDSIENDLMLVVLKHPVQRDLPEVQFAAASMFDDDLQDLLGVGFGTNDLDDSSGLGVKRSGVLVIASASCDDADAVRYGCNPGYELIAGNHFHNSDSSSLCSADSGAPVFIRDEGGKYLLAGINSRATREHQVMMTRCGVASNVTRIDHFIETWLQPRCEELVAQYGLDRDRISVLNWSEEGPLVADPDSPGLEADARNGAAPAGEVEIGHIRRD